MYTAIKTKSIVTFPDLKDWEGTFALLPETGNFNAVAWFQHSIVFFTLENGKPNEKLPDWKYLVRCRIFDPQKELHLWKSSEGIKARLRVDDQEAEGAPSIEYVETTQLLNGTKAIRENNTLVLTEEKGIRYKLPYQDLLSDSLKESDRFQLVTRNYIGYTEIGQASYVDSRFVKIEKVMC